MKTALCLSLAVSLVPPLGTQEVAHPLAEADRAFLEDTRARGLDGWLEWFAPDALVVTADGRLLSEASAIRAYYASIAFPPAGFAWHPESAALADSGELGYSLGSWELRPPGTSEADARELPGGRYLTFWRRQPDGSWRVLADAGGEPGFRSRIDELAAPPLEWSSVTQWSETAASGELVFTIASWTARTPEGERQGKHLTVWRRVAKDAWEVEAEIGFDH